MRSSYKNLNGSRGKLIIEVPKEEIEKRFQEVLLGIQRSARLPGFREGKAPLELVATRYAKEAEEEVVKSLVSETYHRSIVTHKVSPVSLPSISAIQFESHKKLSFEAEFDKAPEFSVKNYKGIKIKKESGEDAQHKMKSQIFDKLLAGTSFDVPKGLVDKQAERLLYQSSRQAQSLGAPEALLRAHEQIKLYFILEQIAKNEKIEADELLLTSRLQKLSEEAKRPLEEVRHVFEQDMRQSMKEAKTIEFLLANAKMEEK